MLIIALRQRNIRTIYDFDALLFDKLRGVLDLGHGMRSTWMTIELLLQFALTAKVNLVWADKALVNWTFEVRFATLVTFYIFSYERSIFRLLIILFKQIDYVVFELGFVIAFAEQLYYFLCLLVVLLFFFGRLVIAELQKALLLRLIVI